MSSRSTEALRAGMKTLRSNPRRALEVFKLATDDDPGMADAWLGRMAAGDRSAATVARLAAARDRLGSDLRIAGSGTTLVDLDVTFDVEYLRWRIQDSTTAELAYIATLLADRKFPEAHTRLAALGTDPKVQFTRAVLMQMTERWPDVLAAVAGREAWFSDTMLSQASALLEAKAAAHLGMWERASNAVETASDSAYGTDPIARDALFLKALIARAQGQDDTARQILGDVAMRWPDFELARTALADTTFGIRVVDHATIDSREDPWDPATGRTPEQRQDDQHTDDARKDLAEAEQTLKAMIGLDEVKQQVRSLKASTAARILRSRKGFPTPAVTNHLLMIGPPGVGKTEVARVVAKTFCGLGILPKRDVFETSKEILAGQYVGSVETQTREFLAQAIGATVFFDEFGELLHGGYAGGDPIGQGIIGAIVPWMENNRDKAVFIAAGYPAACRKVIESNGGLQGRFATTIAFESYPPDKLIEIAHAIVKRSSNIVEPGTFESVLLEPFTRFYNEVTQSPDGDTVRTIDDLNNGRYVRNIIEKAQAARDLRVMDGHGLDDFDLSDHTFGESIPANDLLLLTRDDIWNGLQDATPPRFRKRLESR
ncbi:AAA family ATPase [Mycobacterium avium]|uniref:AAA family ATPase n=1 Tax=Mycobacterium avium TaxID=1764 RepID=UPI000BB07A08|nr:AAA family ATPase [Mycobacterium avium]PBA68963.1 type VII secretion AAA-ATPase EccA [Mycobacterium avium]